MHSFLHGRSEFYDILLRLLRNIINRGIFKHLKDQLAQISIQSNLILVLSRLAYAFYEIHTIFWPKKQRNAANKVFFLVEVV